MNTAMTTTGEASLQDNLMKKLMARAEGAIKEVFLDALGEEEIKQMAHSAVEDFIHGSPAKRYIIENKNIYLSTPDALPPKGKLTVPWEKAGYYNVTMTLPNAEYDPSKDPSTLQGMLRQILVEMVQKNFLDQIKASPEMALVHSGARDEWNCAMPVFKEFIDDYLNKNMATIIRAEREAMLHRAVVTVLSQMNSAGQFPRY
jgi:hypothetical protein